MKILLVVSSLLLSMSLWAQPSEHEMTGLTQAGQLVTVTLVPNKSFLKFQFVGNDVAKIDLKALKIEALFGKGHNKKELPVHLIENTFTINKEKLDTSEILIRVEGKKKKEQFKFRLK